jgi:quercetin dioxygenase-like cupin family protein
MHTIIDTINLTAYKGLKISKLVDVDATQVVKVAMEKGASFPTHESKTDVTLFVLEGNISFYINKQEFQLRKFQAFQFPKNEEHSVTAYENSKFLLIK